MKPIEESPVSRLEARCELQVCAGALRILADRTVRTMRNNPDVEQRVLVSFLVTITDAIASLQEADGLVAELDLPERT